MRLKCMTQDVMIPRETAFETRLSDLVGLAFIDIWSTDAPNLAGFLGLSRPGTYAAVKRGEFPCIRSGRRVRVPVPALLEMLGVG